MPCFCYKNYIIGFSHFRRVSFDQFNVEENYCSSWLFYYTLANNFWFLMPLSVFLATIATHSLIVKVLRHLEKRFRLVEEQISVFQMLFMHTFLVICGVVFFSSRDVISNFEFDEDWFVKKNFTILSIMFALMAASKLWKWGGFIKTKFKRLKDRDFTNHMI
jgi:hypothetical protein